MSRSIARLKCTMLDDPGWQKLTPTAQWVYTTILLQPRLSLAGGLDLKPRRWAEASNHATTDLVEEGLSELEQERFVVIDRDTDELVVRSFTRHDLDPSRLSATTAKGVWNAWERFYSTQLKTVVVTEMSPEVWSRLEPTAPVEARSIHNSTPVRTEAASPFERAKPETCGKQETGRSAPVERETSPPVEVPVSNLQPPVSIDQVSSPTGRDAPPDPDDDERIDQLITAVATARAERLPGNHPPPWIRAVAKNLVRSRAEIITLDTQGLTAAEIDERLDGITTPGQVPSPVHPAVHAAATPECPDCVDGWIEHDGTATPCGTCNQVIGA